VYVSGASHPLETGDAVHFRADAPHALRNPHAAGATVLVVNALEVPALHLAY
jgi:quercetin dioxygenase-like cupin family protein